MQGKFVAYFRVSTRRQGVSGLGLDAQKLAVAQYLDRIGNGVIGEFVEIESGKDDQNRPELQKALTLCKLTGARLLVATLDRLSRDAEFLLRLQKEAVSSFVCADMPDAGTLQVGMMAVLAQHERETISRRTKAALAAAKKRGTTKRRPPDASIAALKAHGGRGRALALKSIQRRADTFVRDLAPMLAELQQAGFTTLAALAQELNRREILTRRDKLVGHWTPAQVDRVLERAKLKRVKVLRRSRDSDRATDAQRTTTEGHS